RADSLLGQPALAHKGRLIALGQEQARNGWSRPGPGPILVPLPLLPEALRQGRLTSYVTILIRHGVFLHLVRCLPATNSIPEESPCPGLNDPLLCIDAVF